MQRITTEYIVSEDRVRLSGEVENAAPVIVWLSLRLLQRLLPALLQWLERQGGDSLRPEILLSFAQQAAKAELEPQAPVRAVAGSTAWLAHSVDLAHSEQALSLTFRGADGANATLILEVKPLRQWLGILHESYVKAGWPLDVWPPWLRESAQAITPPKMALH